MKTYENDGWWIFQSSDDNGRFEFRVSKSGKWIKQVQLASDVDGAFEDEVFIDVNFPELRAMRDILNTALGE